MNSYSDILIYYAPVEQGGLFDYAVEQVLALEKFEQQIVCVATRQLIDAIRARSQKITFVETNTKPNRKTKAARAWAQLSLCRQNVATLVDTVRKYNSKRVLMTAFAEYFAPCWAGPLQQLQHQGVRFGVVVHDPVRDFVVGPRWWHRRSIKSAYSFIDVAFVHDPLMLETGLDRQLPTVVLPQGIYEFPEPDVPESKQQLRDDIGIPRTAKLLLSFGHIRDGKNLDLLIKAIARNPDCHLLVAGREQSSSQKTVGYYQAIAEEAEVADRCHWQNEFIATEDVWRFFHVSDFAVMIYSAAFRSASAVLNTTAQFQLPVLASGGDGPLKKYLSKYDLGVWIEPDSQSAVDLGLRELLNKPKTPNWQGYSAENSWVENASRVWNSLCPIPLSAAQ